MCQHNRLIALNDYAAIEANVEDSLSKVSGMFSYKKYSCENCGKIITILNAVVEETE